MSVMMKAGWASLSCARCQLNLRAVLTSGQSFRWRETGSEEFTGVMRNIVWTLSQTDTLLLYKVHAKFESKTTVELSKKDELSAEDGKTGNAEVSCSTANKPLLIKSQSVVKKEKRKNDVRSRKLQTNHAFLQTDQLIDDSVIVEDSPATSCCEVGSESLKTNNNMEYESLLIDYFQLGVDIEALYQCWSVRDNHFSESSELLPGIRLLRQDPVETLLCFICSSNNNISRIAGMVQRMCAEFGHLITTVGEHSYYTVPSIMRLSQSDVESRLRDLGFGYRARYISQTAQSLLTSAPPRRCDTAAERCCDSAWSCDERRQSYCLCAWRLETYAVARAQLMKLSGVGPKVADCVCLMSLDKLDVVPVDTHVWQIASRDYKLVTSSSKTLTDVLYRQIGDGFRELWGPYAGWAQAVLFASEVAKVKVTVAPGKRSKKAMTNEAESGGGVRTKKR